MRSIFSTFFIILLFPPFAYSQSQIEFEKLVGENVATQSITYAIKQDSIGNIWIGSEEGVLKHNSKFYQIYNTYNGLPESVSNRVTEVFIDSKQRIWIGLEKGVCLYNEALDRFELVGDKAEINPTLVEAIFEDSEGNIWIGGFNGLWKYNVDNPDRTLSRLVTNQSIQAINIFEGNLILGAKKGLFVYDMSIDKLRKVKLPQNKRNISSINFFDDFALIGTKTGDIFRTSYKFKNLQLVSFERALSIPINDIVLDKEGHYYIATDGDGLYYAQNDFSIINHFKEDSNNQKSISSNGIYDLELGKENILWVATYGGGVNYFDSNHLPFQKIQHEINESNSLAVNFTRAIAKDKNGNLWFGTKSGISICDKHYTKWKHFENLSKNKNGTKDIVLALEQDDDFIWAGTYNNGLFKIDINSLKITHYNEVYPEKNILQKVYAIHKDSKENLWVGGIQSDLKVIRPNNKVDSYPIRDVKSISESKSGDIFITGRRGFYRIDDATKAFELVENLKPNKTTLAYSTLNAVFETSEGNLILATNGEGLIFYNAETNKISKLRVSSGIPSDIVQSVLGENDNNIWISTTKGLANIKLSKKDTVINVFDKRDGLASTEYNYGSYAKLNNNLFAFGGPDGVTVFNPNQIKGHDDKPIIAFNEFKLFNKAIEPGEQPLEKHINETKDIVLKSNENSVEIRYTGVLHSSASKIKYTWKLDGYNEEWSTPSYTSFVTFTNLKSGDYIFRVKASNKYGDFGDERKIKISVLAPWWATKKAYALYFLATLIMIYLIIHFTSAIIKKKHADEQIDFLNNITHEIKTPLTILLSSLDGITEDKEANPDSKKRIKTTVKRINSLFEQMLNFHKVTSQDDVVQHISEIELGSHFQKKINNFEPLTKERNIEIVFNNNWNNSLFHFDVDLLDKIILNLFSNAIKYSQENGSIVIDLKKTKNGDLRVDFKDDGLGIPKDQQKFILKRYYRARNAINSQRPGTGLGLIMVKKLIERTGGDIHFVSEENKGTTFTIILKDKKTEYRQHLISKNMLISQQANETDNQLELEEFSDSKILVVEDNNELRAILVNTLGVYFQVYEAENGVEGLEIAHQIFPDIILTDLIMPEMDGMQMARALKEDINLNHIPVFMLTVLQSSKQKLDSIESGISEYLEKPVNIKLLLAKIANTLKWQQKLRKIYIHENELDSASLYRNKHDKTFIEDLENTILNNLDNNSFSVHDLSKSVGMSRTSLYMKLKTLVDLSPQDFIIHAKLKHAKNLLIKGEFSIKEIAYSSGFSNPKYFSTSFKKFYGMTPSGFLESLQKNN
ncbi:two-component regulator propeller domain-containing protein [Seonamhaeicola maritimus]|uniref:histidine kinase n=1 Tax=Seonamhaeicola maritimus TaxID=2591822 RepID=A0A5C7GFW4_9FLAO|nr:two-component regulator propeller domain-containing protein [Seonamhaeicola maritimus]TXG36079.1 response regulator [Seonamhaeicola maritimus]